MTLIRSVRDLGTLARAERQRAGLSLPDAAAWLNVGTRFLFELEHGKNAIQMDKALQVALKLGIRLQASLPGSTPSTSELAPTSQTIEVVAPRDHPAADSWLLLRYAASEVALGVGLPTFKLHPVRGDGRAVHLTQDRTVDVTTTLGIWQQQRAWAQHEEMKVRGSIFAGDECAGLSLAEIVALVRAHSAAPLLDVRTVVRWFVFSFLIGDTEIDADCLNMACSSECPDVFRLLPFSRGLCLAEGPDDRLFLKMRINGVFSGLHLRYRHWVALADDVDIHPKLVFQIMREMAGRVPGLLDRAILAFLGEPPTSSMVIEAITTIRARAARLQDLAAVARRAVNGLATKAQPKVEPLATQLVVEQPRQAVDPFAGPDPVHPIPRC